MKLAGDKPNIPYVQALGILLNSPLEDVPTTGLLSLFTREILYHFFHAAPYSLVAGFLLVKVTALKIPTQAVCNGPC